MSTERPDMPDDLDHAYARAHALADDGRAPSAAARANVLAAAREIAAQAAARAQPELVDQPAVTPVASPVGDVGRGRGFAFNLSSWRVRSGAALCAALLVGFVGWRFDENRRFGAGTQVASLDKSIDVLPAPPQDRPAPRDLPPPYFASSAPVQLPPPPVYVPAPPVDVDEPERPKRAPNGRQAVVVAQAENADRAADLPPPEGQARATFGRALPVTPAADLPPPPKDVVVASAQPNAPAVAAKADVAPPAIAAQIVATKPMPPSQPSAEPTLTVAPPQQRRVEIDGRLASAAVSGGLQQSAPIVASSLGASARLLPALQDAVDRGDIEALKKLLADSATLVDAPDAGGATALLHAVRARRALAVRLLVAAGADPDRADHAGLTPRAAAQAGADPAIAALLPAPR